MKLSDFRFKHPAYAGNPYVSPPPVIRYTLERWTHEDERDNQYGGETWAPTYCIDCDGVQGDYRVGEYIVDDSLSCDTFHIGCVRAYVRWLAVLGTLLCTIRAIMGIDTHAR